MKKILHLNPTKLTTPLSEYDNSVHVNPIHRPDSRKSYLGKFPVLKNNSNESIYYPIIFDTTLQSTQMALSSFQRSYLSYAFSDKPEIELMEIDPTCSPIAQQLHLTLERLLPSTKLNAGNINKTAFEQAFRQQFASYTFSEGQQLAMAFQDAKLILKVTGIKTPGHQPYTFLSDECTVTLNSPSCEPIPPTSTQHICNVLDNTPPKFILNFKAKGIGGHKKELELLVREAFYSRALGSDFAAAYGANHVKGILLYGPPGTGKTLIAREIAKINPKNKVKIVNGPELKNKFVGESQANLRSVFADAISEWNERGKDSALHIIIFDEFDALCPIRGSRTGAGVDDDMVNQLLTLLDGVDSPKNILVIATTNRKDLIDPAALRPGRIDVHISLGLPDEDARFEILDIHTQEAAQHGLLDQSVDLPHWAKETKNYTGAELKQLVDKACHYAQGENFDKSHADELTIKPITKVQQLQKITQTHFKQAFNDVLPLFGINKQHFNFDPNQFVIYDLELLNIIERFKSSLAMFQQNKDLHRLRLLLRGDHGVGKTMLAKYLAFIAKPNYIRMITPECLLGLNTPQQLNLLDEEFSNAHRAEFSIIILDDLENMCEHPHLKMKLDYLLKKNNACDNKTIVIATTESASTAQQFLHAFDEVALLPPVRLKSLRSAESFNTLMLLCKPMGYEVIPSTAQNTDDRPLKMPIEPLMYQIRKFCATEESNKKLDIDLFSKKICHF